MIEELWPFVRIALVASVGSLLIVALFATFFLSVVAFTRWIVGERL